jgi:hypothetical protein
MLRLTYDNPELFDSYGHCSLLGVLSHFIV